MTPFDPYSFYERVAKLYPEEVINSDSKYWKDLDIIVHSFLDSCTGPLIDIGCGKGRYSCYYSHGDVLGIDIAPTNIKVASLRASLIDDTNQRNFHQADITKPLPYQNFQNVICIETLEHLPDLGFVMQNIRKCLSPGGNILITTPDQIAKPWIKSKYLAAFGIEDIYYHGGFSIEELAKLLGDNINIIESLQHSSGFISIRGKKNV